MSARDASSFRTYEGYQAWYLANHIGRRNMLCRAEWENLQPPLVRLSVLSHPRRTVSVERVEAAAAGFLCPHCAGDDIYTWPEAGGNGKDDWWECRDCKAYGAILHRHLTGITQGGHPVLGFSPLAL